MASSHPREAGNLDSTEPANLLVLPVAERVRDLAAALSLNRSQVARVLRVTRATVDSWRQGGEPSPVAAARLQSVLRILALVSVSGTAPLNARFAHHRPEPEQPSLIELLGEEELVVDRVARAIRTAQALEEAASQRSRDSEERLQVRGFEEPDEATRRSQLALNMALRKWPS